jgi:hypothetical protein
MNGAKEDEGIIVRSAARLEPVLGIGDDLVGISPFPQAPVEKEGEDLEKTAFQADEAVAFGIIDGPTIFENTDEKCDKPLLRCINSVQACVEELYERLVRNGHDLGVRHLVDAVGAAERLNAKLLLNFLDIVKRDAAGEELLRCPVNRTLWDAVAESLDVSMQVCVEMRWELSGRICSCFK